MAQKTEIRYIDDLDGSDAVEAVKFALDGSDYEIDLSEGNAQRLRDGLAEFVGAARRVTRNRRRGGNTGGNVTASGRPAERRQQIQAIRDWARANGHQIADRGRIPATVIAAYETRTNGVASPAFSGAA